MTHESRNCLRVRANTAVLSLLVVVVICSVPGYIGIMPLLTFDIAEIQRVYSEQLKKRANMSDPV